MWVIFQKSDGKIVSASSGAEIEQSKEAALKEVVEGLVNARALGDYDAILVKDREQVSRLARSINQGSAKVTSGAGGKLEMVDEGPETSFLAITTNATDFHPVDNVPLIPADGSSFLLVTLQKTDERGAALATGEDEKGLQEVIWLRTDQGSLRDDRDPTLEIRSIAFQNGVARFRLYSGRERRLATVQMLSTNPNLQVGGLQVEFT